MRQKLLFGVCGRIGKQTKLGARFIRIIFILTSLLITFYIGRKLPMPVHDIERFAILFILTSISWYIIVAIGSFWWWLITKPQVVKQIPEGQFTFILISARKIFVIQPIQKNMELFTDELTNELTLGKPMRVVLDNQRKKWPKAEIEMRKIGMLSNGMLNSYPAYIWSIRKK